MAINKSDVLSPFDSRLGVSALLGNLSGGGGGLILNGGGVLSGNGLLLAKFNIVVLNVPLLERSSINLDNCVFDKSLGSDELVVGGVVENIQNSGLSCDLL